MNTNLKTWHHIVFNQDTAKLSETLADAVVFYSPVVHTPQKGKQIVFCICLQHLLFYVMILLNM